MLEQFPFKLVDQCPQSTRIVGPADEKTRHQFIVDDARDLRAFCPVRQVGDEIDPLFDLVQRRAHVCVFPKLKRNERLTVHRQRGKFLDVIDTLEFTFQGVSHEGLKIFCACARPGHTNRDEVDIKTREELGVELRQPPQARDHHHRHQQVGRHWVTGEDSEHRGFQMTTQLSVAQRDDFYAEPFNRVRQLAR